MSDGFEKNVPHKLPTTKQVQTPVRPWDVKTTPREGGKHGEVATATQTADDTQGETLPLLDISEPKEPSRKMVKEILRELTEKDRAGHAHKHRAEPSTPLPPEPGEEVLVASDNSMLIEQESSEVLDEIDNLEAELDSVFSIQHKVEEDLARVREEHEELLRAKQELESQVETLKSIEELESCLKASEEENRIALENIKELEVGLETALQQNAQTRNQLESTQCDLEDMTQLRDAVMGQLEAERVKTTSLDRKISDMTDDRRKLRETVAALETSCEDLKANVGELEEKNRSIQESLHRAGEQIDSEKQKVKYLENSVESYAVVKATLESDLNAARTALKSIRNRLSAATTLMKRRPADG